MAARANACRSAIVIACANESTKYDSDSIGCREVKNRLLALIPAYMRIDSQTTEIRRAQGTAGLVFIGSSPEVSTTRAAQGSWERVHMGIGQRERWRRY